MREESARWVCEAATEQPLIYSLHKILHALWPDDDANIVAFEEDLVGWHINAVIVRLQPDTDNSSVLRLTKTLEMVYIYIEQQNAKGEAHDERPQSRRALHVEHMSGLKNSQF